MRDLCHAAKAESVEHGGCALLPVHVRGDNAQTGTNRPRRHLQARTCSNLPCCLIAANPNATSWGLNSFLAGSIDVEDVSPLGAYIEEWLVIAKGRFLCAVKCRCD